MDKLKKPFKLSYGIPLVTLLLIGVVSAVLNQTLIDKIKSAIKDVDDLTIKLIINKQSANAALQVQRGLETDLQNYMQGKQKVTEDDLVNKLKHVKEFVIKALAEQEIKRCEDILGGRHQVPKALSLAAITAKEKLKDDLANYKGQNPSISIDELSQSSKDLGQKMAKVIDAVKVTNYGEAGIKAVENFWNDGNNAKFQKIQHGINLEKAMEEAKKALDEFKNQLSDDAKDKLYLKLAILDQTFNEFKSEINRISAIPIVQQAETKLKEVETLWGNSVKYQKFQVGVVQERAKKKADKSLEYYLNNPSNDKAKDELNLSLKSLEEARSKFETEIKRFHGVISNATSKINGKKNADPKLIEDANNALKAFETQPSWDNHEALKTALKALGIWGYYIENPLKSLFAEYPKTGHAIKGGLTIVGLAGLGWMGGSIWPIPIRPKPSSPPTSANNVTDPGPDKTPGLSEYWWLFVLVALVVVAIVAGAVWFFYYRAQTNSGSSKVSDGGEKGEDEGSKASTASSTTGAGAKTSTTARSSKTDGTASTGASSSSKPKGSSTGKSGKTSS